MYDGTETPLASSATFTGRTRMTNRDDRVVGTVFSDTAGTLFIEQSSDPRAGDPASAAAAAWDVQTEYPVVGNDGKGFSEELVAPYWRVRFTNSANPQTVFRLHARTASAGDS